MNVYPSTHYPFPKLYYSLAHALVNRGAMVEATRWQSQSIEGKDEMTPKEMTHVSFDMKIPEGVQQLQTLVEPNLPWAEDHFLERVSGEPLNPAPSEAWWPFAVKGNEAHKVGNVYSHTYPERIWSKRAGHMAQILDYERMGIRFPIGDLDDVVRLLAQEPTTRQAYLPIWFPEDTGVTHGQRVPCTLGYHFLMRRGRLDITYYMRSCDFVRHFRDDVYMAARLCQWVAREIDNNIVPGSLNMHISSLHIFRGDLPRLEEYLAT